MSNKFFRRWFDDISHPIDRFFIPLLRFYRIRYWFVRVRFFLLKRKMRFGNYSNPKILETTVAHNLSAFDFPRAAFGCGNRMESMIYPIIAYFPKDRERVKILVVGCRTEDDIFWLRAHRFSDTYGLDLFSYSDNILIGDIHETAFQDKTYNVILLGWMIAYTKDPATVIRECARILKPGGLLGISLEHVSSPEKKKLGSSRANILNSTKDIIDILDHNLNHKVVFEYDHYVGDDTKCVVISKLL